MSNSSFDTRYYSKLFSYMNVYQKQIWKVNIFPITGNSSSSSSSDKFNLTWVLPVPNSDHGYLVRLHFCDIVSKALYELYFDVYINGYPVYTDLDLSSQTLSLASPYYIDFVADSNPSGSIHISVGPSNRSLPSKINAILNGLEILKIHGVAKFSEPKKENHIGVVIGSVLGCFVLICLVLAFVVIALRWRRRKRKQKLALPSASAAWSPAPGNSYSRLMELTAATSPASNLNLSLKIPFAEILLATNNFDDNSLVGSGGFGKVYRGVLRDGTAVAVKRGGRNDGNGGSRQGLAEFQAEILVLTRIRHRHLVSLIGYCDERSEMIVVYEFMANGPLRDHLYGSTKPRLSWRQRLEICIGSARGLHYLHTGTSQGIIIHRDVKSSNILLDKSYTAKVADFGLSRSAGAHIDQAQAHVSTGVKGSFGYLDPEYFRTQQLTEKSDVYSFGVVLLEVLCARPVIDRSLSWEEVNLAEWGMKWQKRGHIEKVVDPMLKDEIDPKSLKKFGETVEKCLAQYGVDRPAMGDVLWNLECALHLQESAARQGLPEDCSAGPSQVAGAEGSLEVATSQVFPCSAQG